MKFITSLFLIASIFIIGAAAQETEPAATSNVTGISLPSNAQRLLPGSIPAEVSAAFDKITAGADGKLDKGESEVLVWSGGNYRKTSAQTTVDRIANSLKSAGWQFSVEGSEDGLTVFSATLDRGRRRAVVGFYGATDDALVFSWMELVKPGEAPKTPAVSTESADIIGTWTNGRVSTIGEKNVYTGVVTNRGGTGFKYAFTADGRFEFTGYMESTMYGCTTIVFNDKRGSYKINGDTITLQPTKNYWKNEYSCSPKSNKEQNYTLKPETYTFRVRRNDYGKEEICLNNGKDDACYERKQ